MTKDEVLHLLDKISARWPSFKVSNMDATMEVYLEDLGEFTYVEVDKAYRSMRGEKWAPTTSEILEILSPAPVGEPWMERRAGSMGFFEKTHPPHTLAELMEKREQTKREPDPNAVS